MDHHREQAEEGEKEQDLVLYPAEVEVLMAARNQLGVEPVEPRDVEAGGADRPDRG